MRFFLPIALCLLLAGWGLTLRGKDAHALSLSIGHRSMQRLIFDEIHLRQDKKWKAEEVGAILEFSGQSLRVLLTALPTRDSTQLNAIAIQVDEDQAAESREMILVKVGSVEEKILSLPPSPAPLAKGRMLVNGKVSDNYAIFEHPFTSTLQRGEGPLARRGKHGLEVSRQSEGLAILRDLAKTNEATLPALQSSEWAVWVSAEKKWRIWGHWPQGWEL